jgi:hypothetical protein
MYDDLCVNISKLSNQDSLSVNVNIFCPPARQFAELPLASQQFPLLQIKGLKSKKAGDGPKWWCHENDSSAARRVRANAGAARDGQARRGQAGA